METCLPDATPAPADLLTPKECGIAENRTANAQQVADGRPRASFFSTIHKGSALQENGCGSLPGAIV